MTSAWWRMKLAPRVSDAISDAWASYSTDRNHYLPVPDVTDILCDSLWLHYLMIPFSMHQTRAILRINSLTMREAPRVGRIVWTQRIMKWVRADLLESQSREEEMKSLRTILESLSMEKKRYNDWVSYSQIYESDRKILKWNVLIFLLIFHILLTVNRFWIKSLIRSFYQYYRLHNHTVM